MAPALNLPAPSRGADNTLASSRETKNYASGGIIYPPPELRRTIDKAAELIAKKDPSFEASIKATELNNPKFAFLSETDAYHAYYVSRRDAVRRGEVLTSTVPEPSTSQITAAAQQESQQAQSAPEQPEPFEFSADMPNVTAIDLDTIKLTALFTAQKGRSFASALLAKEGNSFQFEFLRPSHSMYGYYSLLVQQYQQIIAPRPELLEKVKIGAFGSSSSSARAFNQTGSGKAGGRPALLEQAKKRAEWEKWSREKRKRADEDQEQERAAFNEIDWQDFVVVGTVELTETDQHVDLPPPRSIREMESMTMAQKRMASMIMESQATGDADGEEVEEVRMPGSRPTTEQVRQTINGQDTTIKVRKDYVSRGLAGRNKASAGAGGQGSTTRCPVCGEEVPLDEMGEHVRFELLNPQYREQRQQLEVKKAQQGKLQAGADPSYYLKQLTSARTDIFGDKEDEEVRLKRETEERRLAKEKEKIIWDGHARSRGAARELHARNVGLEEDMNKLSQKPHISLPEYGPMIPTQAPDANAHKQASSQEKLPTEPVSSEASTGTKRQIGDSEDSAMQHPSKQQRLVASPPSERSAESTTLNSLSKKEDGTLHPEKAWIEGSSSPTVALVISIVDSEGTTREEPYEAALKSTIATLREYVHQDILSSNIAASKIKVKVGKTAATLKQSLAHWNLSNGDTVTVNISK